MRIFKGNVGFEMTVQSFLDLLEEDALEEIVETIISIEQSDSFYGEGDFEDYESGLLFLGSLTEAELDDLANTNDIEIMSQEEFEEVFGQNALEEVAAQVPAKTPMSEEDAHIKRIVERFGCVGDAD